MKMVNSNFEPPEWLIALLYMLGGIVVCAILLLVFAGPIWLAAKHENVAYLLWWIIPLGAGAGLELYREEF